MVLVEPWGPASGRPLAAVRKLFADQLETLEPPVGWALHEGLLPPARDWVEPVVGVSWAELLELAAALGDDTPTGMWLVRLSRQGGWLSLAPKVKGPAATRVRALIKSHHHPRPGPWDGLARAIKDRLDPRGVLNPYV